MIIHSVVFQMDAWCYVVMVSYMLHVVNCIIISHLFSVNVSIIHVVCVFRSDVILALQIVGCHLGSLQPRLQRMGWRRLLGAGTKEVP